MDFMPTMGLSRNSVCFHCAPLDNYFGPRIKMAYVKCEPGEIVIDILVAF